MFSFKTFNACVLWSLRSIRQSRTKSLSRFAISQGRSWSLNNCRGIGFSALRLMPSTVSVTFIQSNGTKKEVNAKVGSSLMEVGIENDVGIVAACEGTLCCSTCHLIASEEDFDNIPDPLTDEELDMLDTADNVTPTSRLSCQIMITNDLDGMTFTVPESFSDARTL